MTNLGQYLPKKAVSVISTEKLGMAFEPEQQFENPDGSDIVFNKDYSGKSRNATTIPGPFAEIKETEIPLNWSYTEMGE